MSEPQQFGTAKQIAVVNSDDDLFDLCRRQAAAMKITYGTMDRFTGFTEQYWSKKLAPCAYSQSGKRGSRRGWSSEAFQAALVAFCFDLVAVHNPEKEAKLRAWMAQKFERPADPRSMLTVGKHEGVVIRLSARHMRKLSKRAAQARRQKIPKKKRSRIARNAAKARWHKPKIIEITGTLAAPPTECVAAIEKISERASTPCKKTACNKPSYRSRRRGPVRWR